MWLVKKHFKARAINSRDTWGESLPPKQQRWQPRLFFVQKRIIDQWFFSKISKLFKLDASKTMLWNGVFSCVLFCLSPHVPLERCANQNSTVCTKKTGSGPTSLNAYRYVFIAAQLLHGAGAAAILTLGPTLLDETLDKTRAPLYIGIFESSFVLGPAIG